MFFFVRGVDGYLGLLKRVVFLPRWLVVTHCYGKQVEVMLNLIERRVWTELSL